MLLLNMVIVGYSMLFYPMLSSVILPYVIIGYFKLFQPNPFKVILHEIFLTVISYSTLNDIHDSFLY
jgi:hypothetical protein